MLCRKTDSLPSSWLRSRCQHRDTVRPGRTLLRLQAALPGLAAGEPVATVARQAGYDTASAFVAAFRRQTGSTPAGYFRNTPG